MVNLSNPLNADDLRPAGRPARSLDNDPQPSLSVDDVTVTEGNAGTVNATFTTTLSAPSGQTASVDYATADDTATTSTSGSPPAHPDYSAATGTLTFPAGQTTRTVTITVQADHADEYDETFCPEPVQRFGRDDRRRPGRRHDHR